ncbi:hypothetical protein HD806DRAFT_534187 [Xylariaceae sp. AK1471]|nr:hypothetical protein HD806DRAFT_534187 [Xylariaceae sp. AK1471]
MASTQPQIIMETVPATPAWGLVSLSAGLLTFISVLATLWVAKTPVLRAQAHTILLSSLRGFGYGVGYCCGIWPTWFWGPPSTVEVKTNKDKDMTARRNSAAVSDVSSLDLNETENETEYAIGDCFVGHDTCDDITML